MLHGRALMRLSRRRPSLALGLMIAAGSALTTAVAAASVAVHQVELHSRIEPLAPAPAPPTPPVVASRHHFLPHFGKINPLRGIASWYGIVRNGHKTASGEVFDASKMTAAHRTLPMGTMVRVTDVDTKRSVVVKINDRGVLAPTRVIDLSSGAAEELGVLRQGLANVKLEVLGRTTSRS
jgi:rare lipoprotein A